MGVCKHEPTIEEILSDPMMEMMYRHSGTTADDVRALMQEVAARLAMTRANESEETIGV